MTWEERDDAARHLVEASYGGRRVCLLCGRPLPPVRWWHFAAPPFHVPPDPECDRARAELREKGEQP
jgi:hypothetical protein